MISKADLFVNLWKGNQSSISDIFWGIDRMVLEVLEKKYLKIMIIFLTNQEIPNNFCFKNYVQL
jgi:hypothetical protein